MPVVLLLLGLVTTLAGLVLVASGFAVRDGTFDTEVLTPGTIAIVGGLLLIGLGFVVRELRRIERALAARPMARLTRVDDAAAAEASDTATPIPPPIPKTEPQVASAAATAAEAPVEDAALERLRAKLPTIPASRKRPGCGGGRCVARFARSSRLGGRHRGNEKRRNCRSRNERHRRIRPHRAGIDARRARLHRPARRRSPCSTPSGRRRRAAKGKPGTGPSCRVGPRGRACAADDCLRTGVATRAGSGAAFA